MFYFLNGFGRPSAPEAGCASRFLVTKMKRVIKCHKLKPDTGMSSRRLIQRNQPPRQALRRWTRAAHSARPGRPPAQPRSWDGPWSLPCGVLGVRGQTATPRAKDPGQTWVTVNLSDNWTVRRQDTGWGEHGASWSPECRPRVWMGVSDRHPVPAPPRPAPASGRTPGAGGAGRGRWPWS